jgi:UDPglucose 6-dehydrogenase
MKIAIIGTGYVGLVSGACLSTWGHDIVCVDIDGARIAALSAGDVPFYESDLAPLVMSGVERGKLRFTTNLRTALRGTDIVLLAVGTPASRHEGEADLTHVFEAARAVALALDRSALIVTKSTVPVGTGDRIEALIRALRPDLHIGVASNPEFLREGSAVADFLHPDRVVIGCESNGTRELLMQLYHPLLADGVGLVSTTRRSAELIKYASNAFLATKVAFINEIADLCEKVDANVDEIARGMGLDRRIGPDFLKAGPGYGGSCFPKDTTALLRTAQENGVSLRIVESTIASNAARKREHVQRVRRLIGQPLLGKRIAILGLTFKAETDDMRDAPSLTLIPALQRDGAKVVAFDPKGCGNAGELLDDIEFFDDPYNCCDGADAVVLMTDWECLRSLDYGSVGARMRTRALLDLRGLSMADALAHQHGFVVDRIGQQASAPSGNAAILIRNGVRPSQPRPDVHNGFSAAPRKKRANNSTREGKEETGHEQINGI